MTSVVSSRPAAESPVQPPPRHAGGEWRDGLVGTRRLVRLVLRRDRVRLTLWIVGLVTLMVVSAQSIDSLYRRPEQLRSYVDTVGDNPALVIFAGPGYGFDDPNVGVVLVNETSLWMALSCGLMSVFLVNRHTRAEEESERADLVRSAVVGRHAPVVAALAVATLANAAVFAGSFPGTVAFGYPVAGTAALTGGFCAVGVVFAAVTAVAAQVASTGRGTLGLAAGLAGLAFVGRGVADIGAPPFAWLTPFGWGIGVRAYAGERWWAFGGLALFAAGFAAVAFALSVRRDLGSGILAPSAGPASARPRDRRPLGLAVRLQRGAVIGWTLGLFSAGVVYGTVADDIDAMLADNPEFADYIEQLSGATLAESYLAMALRLLALVATGFAISSALRTRSEEASGHAEHVLAAAVGRWRWAGSQLAVTVVATNLVIAAGGIGTGLGYGATTGDWGELPHLILAALVTVPAVLVIAGVAVALFGWLPHATVAAWGAIAAIAVVDLFATVLRLPDWLVQVSPLEHVPALPAESWSTLPAVLLTALAAALFAAGLVGFRRRDLVTA